MAVGRPFLTQGSKTGSVRLTPLRRQPIKDKNGVCHLFSKYCNFVNNSWNCTKAQGDLGCPFDYSYFDLGVTSRDLSMSLTVLLHLGARYTDTLVLLLAHYERIGCDELWLKTGTSKTRRYFPVHEALPTLSDGYRCIKA